MVFAIFRLGQSGWVYVTHKADRDAAEKRLDRFKKDMPHERFRLDYCEVRR